VGGVRALHKLSAEPPSRQHVLCPRVRSLESTVEALLNVNVGGAAVEYGERRAIVPVVFREPKDLPVLGATTLESLGYQLDPISKRLKP